MTETFLFLTSVFAGAVASIAGFGIGSLVTPVLSLSLGTKLAVALVSIPHFVGTLLRFVALRSHVDRRVLLGFGLASAAGGLAGALLNSRFDSPALTVAFGAILLFAGFSGASGLGERMRFEGPFAWAAGALSGLLGGLVGNQGGIRSAALVGARIPKEAFVATATAIGLVVDAARMPVYFWTEHAGILANGRPLALSTLGVVAGTFLGTRLLGRLPERLFRRAVSTLVLFLGLYMLLKGLRA